MTTETYTTVTNGVSAKVEPIYFYRATEIPKGLSTEIQLGVLDFIRSSHVPEGVDKTGFYRQTLQAIAGATVFGGNGCDLFLGMQDGHLLTYVLAHFGNDIDGKITYTVTQAWVRKDFRGRAIVKDWWREIKQRAKDCLAGHLIIISSRNPKAYERFLGMKPYCTMLKEDL